MDVVTAICDRIVVLSYGEIIAEGRPHEAIADPAVVAAYLGQRAAARHLVGAPS
jgi:branched-chain amino acid transport system ATP-binding protein